MVAVKRRSGTATVDGHGGHSKKQKLQSHSRKSGKTAKQVKDERSSDDSDESDVTDGHRFNGLAGSDDEEEDSSDQDGSEGGVRMTGALPVASVKETYANKNKVASDADGVKTTSREAHAKQKTLAQERKAAKPNADIILRSKKLWERLRRKSHVPLEERKKLVAELFDIITGRVKEFVLKHDAVRVIQTAIKYANLEQKKMITRELKGEFRGLAESRYAKFLIGKLLVQGDSEIRDIIVPEFYGNVRRLIKHPEASWILDDIYRTVATPEQKANILREWYGPEFVIFRANSEQGVPTSDLSEILAKTPEKRSTIMRSLHELINNLVQKKLTGFILLHDAMLQYYLNTKPGTEDAAEFMELLKGDEEGDLLKNLAFTSSGSRVVCRALAYGTAKERKQILRAYKDIIPTLASDAKGHLVLLACYDVIDDTVLTSKAIFPELIGKNDVKLSDDQQQRLLEMINDFHARVPLLYLFSGQNKALVPQSTNTLLDEIHEIRSTTSKKDPEVRRKELLKSLSPQLLSLIPQQLSSLLQTSFGCQYITQVLVGAEGPREDKVPALEAIATACEGDPTDPDHPVRSPSAGKMLKTLVQGGKFNRETGQIELVQPPLNFGDMLFANMKGNVPSWATGEGSFIVVNLLETESFSHKAALLETLKKCKAQLAGASAAKSSQKHEAVESGDGRKAKKKKPVKETGNKGSQLLLQKL